MRSEHDECGTIPNVILEGFDKQAICLNVGNKRILQEKNSATSENIKLVLFVSLDTKNTLHTDFYTFVCTILWNAMQMQDTHLFPECC